MKVKFENSGYVAKVTRNPEIKEELKKIDNTDLEKAKVVLKALDSQSKEYGELGDKYMGVVILGICSTLTHAIGATMVPELAAAIPVTAGFSGLFAALGISEFVRKKSTEEQRKEVYDIYKEEVDKKHEAYEKHMQEVEEQRKLEAETPIALSIENQKKKDDYINELIAHGADEKLISMPAIQQLIDYQLANTTDQFMCREGQIAIDGTFTIDSYNNIMNGKTEHTLHKISYCDDGNPEHYLKIVNVYLDGYYDENGKYLEKYNESKEPPIYINKDGLKAQDSIGKTL